jgi:hypothetical protein
MVGLLGGEAKLQDWDRGRGRGVDVRQCGGGGVGNGVDGGRGGGTQISRDCRGRANMSSLAMTCLHVQCSDGCKCVENILCLGIAQVPPDMDKGVQKGPPTAWRESRWVINALARVDVL